MSYKENSGRSIFELIAVMAVIGLLSVTVVKSYNKLVTKAKADAQKRQIAMIVKETQQKMLGGTVADITKQKINDTEYTIGKGKEGSAKDYFGVKVKTTDKALCEELTDATFLSPALITVNGEKDGECPSDIVFYFPKDPSNTAPLVTGDESIFDEDNSSGGGSGGSEGSGETTPTPGDYDGDGDGCTGNNFTYCSNGSCVSTADDCPKPEDFENEEDCENAGFKYCQVDGSCIAVTDTCSCSEILDCGSHGIWKDTKCACSCDNGWYGNTCNSYCGGWRDVDGECHLCSVRDLFQATEEECSRCGNERKIFTQARKDYCGLVDCGQGYFQAKTGTCYLCSDPNSYTVADEEACLKCGDQREMYGNYCALKTCDTGNFHNDTGKCVSCSTVTDMTNIKGSCFECANTDTPLFELNTGYCVPCSSEYGSAVRDLSTSAENCSVCANTNYPRFYGLNGNCYSCADASSSYAASSPASASECSKCDSSVRKIFNWYSLNSDGTTWSTWCGFINCPSETFQAVNGSCMACQDSVGVPVASQEECNRCAQFNEPRFFQGNHCYSCIDDSIDGNLSWSSIPPESCAQCENRKYCESDGSCIRKTESCSCPTVLTCGTHGTWDDTKCECACDDGWYGETCSSDCNEMGTNVSATECAKCSNRKYCSGTNVCIPLTQECLTCSSVLTCGENGTWDAVKCECACDDGWYGETCDLECEVGLYKDVTGRCIMCENHSAYTTVESCMACKNTDYPRFLGSNDYSYLCSYNGSVTSDSERCSMCDGTSYPRHMSGNTCVLGAESPCSGHGTKNSNGTCSCLGGYTGENCETQITCVNGTWSETGCACDDGWYGETCNSDCEVGLYKDARGRCIMCEDHSAYTTVESCMACKNTDYPRFLGSNDYSYLCSYNGSVTSDSERCSMCDGTPYPRHMSDDTCVLD